MALSTHRSRPQIGQDLMGQIGKQTSWIETRVPPVSWLYTGTRRGLLDAVAGAVDDDAAAHFPLDVEVRVLQLGVDAVVAEELPGRRGRPSPSRIDARLVVVALEVAEKGVLDIDADAPTVCASAIAW